MSETYGPEVQAILRSVEGATGAAVEVMDDPSLSVLATVSMAGRGTPVHLVRVRPGSTSPDYLIAYQCGFILRQYTHPADQRKGLAATEHGRATVRRQVLGAKGAAQHFRLPTAAAEGLANQMVDGLGTQIRSIPIGMRVDQWIHGTYPGLHSLQAKAIDEQQQLSAASLGGQAKAIAPPTVYAANAAMNAAFAIFCDDLIGRPLYVQPYRAMGIEAQGRRLLEILQSGPTGPAHDYDLVRLWARELGVTDWYEWVPIP